MIDNQQAGRNMLLLRLQKGLSQQSLADLCNVTHQAVSKWENGTALPDMQTLLFLSHYFGVSMETILTADISLDPEEEAPEALPAAAPVPEPPALPKAPTVPEGPRVPAMRVEQIMDLVPFASRETLETLVEHCAEPLDEEKICDLAPFLSKAYLDKLVRNLLPRRPELAFKLAPFLPRQTVDWLVLGDAQGE